jgi:hypothetical protein
MLLPTMKSLIITSKLPTIASLNAGILGDFLEQAVAFVVGAWVAIPPHPLIPSYHPPILLLSLLSNYLPLFHLGSIIIVDV